MVAEIIFPEEDALVISGDRRLSKLGSKSKYLIGGAGVDTPRAPLTKTDTIKDGIQGAWDKRATQETYVGTNLTEFQQQAINSSAEG